MGAADSRACRCAFRWVGKELFDRFANRSTKSIPVDDKALRDPLFPGGLRARPPISFFHLYIFFLLYKQNILFYDARKDTIKYFSN